MRNRNPMRTLMVAIVLTVSVAGCDAISGRETVGEYVDDTGITSTVKANIVNEMGLKQINVETMQNVVQLSGFVDSHETKTRAGNIAWGVQGVQGVKNNLVVR